LFGGSIPPNYPVEELWFNFRNLDTFKQGVQLAVEHLAGVPRIPACGIRRVQRKAAMDALAHQSQPQSVLGREGVQPAFNKLICANTVPKLDPISTLGIVLSEKQIPQVVENIEN
jgi:hypothetical protein